MFRTLTSVKFDTLFLSSDCLSIGETDAIFVLSGKTPLEILLFIASANGWERDRKHFSRYFNQLRRNFVRSCSLFVFYILNFRSDYTIKLKLFNSLWIVKVFHYFKYARMITIMLHYFVNDTSSSSECVCPKQSYKVSVPTIFPLCLYSDH